MRRAWSDMQVSVIESTSLAKEVYDIVSKNIEYNNEALFQNIYDAAKVSRHKLAVRSGEWIGRNRVGHDRMFHRKGWKIYKENWYRVRGAEKKCGRRSAVVASKIEPSLTHLLEFGHNIVMPWLDDPYTGNGPFYRTVDEYSGEGIIGRTRAFYYIAAAFYAGKTKLLEAKVDNP